MSRYWSKLRCLKCGWVTLNANFRGKGTSPTNKFWHHKTRVHELSHGEKNAENYSQLSRVHQRHRRQTDRQTTDGMAMAYSERNVVTFAKKLAASYFARLLIGVQGRESHIFVNFAPQKPKIGRNG